MPYSRKARHAQWRDDFMADVQVEIREDPLTTPEIVTAWKDKQAANAADEWIAEIRFARQEMLFTPERFARHASLQWIQRLLRRLPS